jgi:hypothetical protein
MPEEYQLLCQKLYLIDYMIFKCVFVKNINLLNAHGNGQICTIMDGN